MGAVRLSEGDFIHEVQKRVPELTEGQVRKVVTALKAEVIDCVTNGYTVPLTGLVTFEPTAKPGRKKGTVVRNPFDGTEKTLRADEPPVFGAKVKRSPSIKGKFPSIKSADGKALYKALTGKTV